MIKHSITLLFLGLICLCSCQKNTTDLEPKITLTPLPHHIGNLPHAFPPETTEESQTDWGKELKIGNAFAKELDLYRAITCYKRALMLIPEEATERRLEIEYNIVQSYYLGNKYQDTINSFECGELRFLPATFPPFHDLLVILYDSYLKIGDCEKSQTVLTLIKQYYPETADKLELSQAIQTRNIQAIRESGQAPDFLKGYCLSVKSPKKAELLNAILPGAGYAYVGQKQSAFTSFALNTLFIAASYYFFREGNYAAGAITSSLEFGWYMGGINGAGLEAKAYNNAIYEGLGKQYLVQYRLFPVLMFQTTF